MAVLEERRSKWVNRRGNLAMAALRARPSSRPSRTSASVTSRSPSVVHSGPIIFKCSPVASEIIEILGARREEEGSSSPHHPCLDDMLTEEETPSLGSGLEYDLWEGQFAFSGALPLNLPPSPLTKERNRDKSYLNKACSQLNQHVQMLQEQMSMLADNQTNGDERYTRVKQDNATLQARVLMLEEQIREVELRAQEKLRDEERWHREMVSRMESEKQLQLENCAIRLQSIELENCSLREEANRYRTQAEKLRSEVLRLEEEQSRYEANLAALKEELELVIERERENNQTTRLNQQFAEELNQELECLRLEHKKTLEELELRGSGVSPTTHEQLRSKFSQLREDNRRLQEAHDEMQALLLTKSVEEGRSLLTGHQSLAAELEALSQDEPAAESKESEVRIMLKEQQEVNAQLRRYIDGILLNIVDNYPQLLEVKPALP
ncbi:rab11 family-interacting protein 4B-like isoform X5 [Cimex lectularius]|uniref:FIP-RBD domain-containing protein n=1 Tax=Cimex lectularius TaxID=79782 RepID=A0A8I6RGP6_CIMLE|nr:rab11 family-interacting protein 4B-like isoform X5 [Cimex lectularius]